MPIDVLEAIANSMDRRMKQLEQRVESLMDILVAKAQEADKASETTAPNTPTLQEHSEDARSALDQPPMNHLELPPETSNTANYDPVEAGLLTEGDASDLLSDFRQNHTGVFPFVLVDVNTDAAALRRQQPFLFLAIMGAMSHKKPSTQKLLGDAFREQIATRVVGQSTKSLEILQGLLVHTAYYHFFYRPGKQQLSLMVQLCVAMAQDYGLSKKWRSNQRCCSFEQSKAGQRALLGTYYLAAA